MFKGLHLVCTDKVQALLFAVLCVRTNKVFFGSKEVPEKYSYQVFFNHPGFPPFEKCYR